MQQQKSGFTPALLIFLVLSQQIGWQGYGQVNRTVVDVVMGYINTNVSQYTSTSNYDTFNTAFSDELNRRWDPAWNVFTIVTTSAHDAVLYGYAFRDQWMWYNDYRVNGVVLAFVIWKDYNCQGWKTVGKNGGSTAFNVNGIANSAIGNTFYPSDLWNAAKTFSQSVSPSPNSVVASQDNNSEFYGRICVVGSNYFYSKKDYPSQKPFSDYSGGQWGNVFFFQTR